MGLLLVLVVPLLVVLELLLVVLVVVLVLVPLLVVLVSLEELPTKVLLLEVKPPSHAEMEQLQLAPLELSSALMALHSTAVLVLVPPDLALLLDLALLADLDLSALALATAFPVSLEELDAHTDVDTEPPP